MDTEQENARAIFPHLATCFYCQKESLRCLQVERPVLPEGTHLVEICESCRSCLAKQSRDENKPGYGNCFFCGKGKLDCLEFSIPRSELSGTVLVYACAACRWVRTPKPEPRVYDRKTAQPDTCRVIVELCHPNAKLPWQASPGDACYDLFCPEDITLDYGETRVIKLGLKIQLEPGWEAQIRGRSSLQAAGLLFTVGTIDERYRKEIGAIVTSMHLKLPPSGFDGNTPSRNPRTATTRAMIGSPYHIAAGERIAQMAIRRAPAVELVAGVVEPTERGGFGSTGR